jgi:hypothetical protein
MTVTSELIMLTNKTLLIVAHVPSVNTQRLAQLAQQAITPELIDNVSVVLKTPLATTVDDVLQADAIIIGTTENFGYMAGLTKDFFERIFYPVLEQKQGLPVACYIRAGLDGTGTQRAIESIIKGLRWRWVQQPLVLKGEWKDGFETQVNELVLTVAAGLSIGIL